jgi:phosphoglycerate kinase
MINSVDKLDLKEKRVLLQINFDSSPYSYRQTIDYLLSQKAFLLLIGTTENDSSFLPWLDELEEMTGQSIPFLAQSIFEKSFSDRIKNCFDQNQIVLLENLAIYPEEKEGESVLAQALSRLADFYVNEAFGSSYLNHASLVLLPDFLESAGGFNLMKEREAIVALNNHPTTVILGGDKILESSKLLLSFLKKADHILVSGKIAEAIFRVRGISPGKEWPNNKIVRLINQIDLTDTRLHLPIDVVTGSKNLDDSYSRIFAPGEVRKEDDIYDIGPETIRLFQGIIDQSKALVWRGPLGLYTWPEFSKGTQAIAERIAQNEGLYSVVGGKETTFFLKKIGLLDKFSHVSEGGETMMQLAAGQKLSSLEALLRNKLIG